MLVKKISQKYFSKKKMVRENLVQTILGQKNLGQKKFLVKNILGHKKFQVKQFWVKVNSKLKTQIIITILQVVLVVRKNIEIIRGNNLLLASSMRSPAPHSVNFASSSICICIIVRRF